MPSVLSPRLRWRQVSLPLLEAKLDPIERAQRVIAGSLTLWSSRIVGFQWAEHVDSEFVYRYCVARINSDRNPPRPTAQQLIACLAEVGDHVDSEAYQALNILALSIDRAMRRAESSDFFDVNDEPAEGVDDLGNVGADERASSKVAPFAETSFDEFPATTPDDSRLANAAIPDVVREPAPAVGRRNSDGLRAAQARIALASSEEEERFAALAAELRDRQAQARPR